MSPVTPLRRALWYAISKNLCARGASPRQSGRHSGNYTAYHGRAGTRNAGARQWRCAACAGWGIGIGTAAQRVWRAPGRITAVDTGDVSSGSFAALPLDQIPARIEMLQTGIKVIDLLCPFVKGGKAGLFGGAGVEKQC